MVDPLPVPGSSSPYPYQPPVTRWYTATVNTDTPSPNQPQAQGLTPPDTRAQGQPEEERPDEEPEESAEEEHAGPDAAQEPENGQEGHDAPAEEEAQAAHPATDAAALLSLDQAAAYAGRKPTTLRRALRADKLPRRYRPGLYGPELVFAPADLDAWLSDMARAVETMPGTPANTKRDGDAAATDGAAQQPATDSEPSTALVEPNTLSSPIKLYALVALAYAQRLAAVEERLATVEEEAQQRAARAAQQQAAALDARIAQLEARQQQQPQQEPRNTQERRGAGPDRRSPDAVWIAEERRRADRRAQQDRERFEETVMGQYVPPAPAAIPRADDLAPGPTIEEASAGEGHRRHPTLLTRILAHFR